MFAKFAGQPNRRMLRGLLMRAACIGALASGSSHAQAADAARQTLPKTNNLSRNWVDQQASFAIQSNPGDSQSYNVWESFARRLRHRAEHC